MNSPSSNRGGETPSLWLFLWIWLSLGSQSFGGGTATLALIRREVVERREWMDDSEFVRDWALCQIAPGINLLGLTILIGRRLRGFPGVVLAQLGRSGVAASLAGTVAARSRFAALGDLSRQLPGLFASRARIQARRRVPQREIDAWWVDD